MNSTFMFGEDNFNETTDYSFYYQRIGGLLTSSELNSIINSIYKILDEKYLNSYYLEDFPTIEEVINKDLSYNLNKLETQKIIKTFSFYELGYIPGEYIQVLKNLSSTFVLACVIDIWAPKDAWIEYFNSVGILSLFTLLSFSSDIKIVKPSPKPYQRVLSQLNFRPYEALIIGDSIRRDLGSAKASNIDCILVNGSQHPDAIASFNNLLDFYQELINT